MSDVPVTYGICGEKHKRVDADISRLEKRADKHGEEISETSLLLAKQTVILDRLLKQSEEMTAKPAKRWESLVSQLITLLVAAAFGALAGKFL